MVAKCRLCGCVFTKNNPDCGGDCANCVKEIEDEMRSQDEEDSNTVDRPVLFGGYHGE